jgi:hypothetical protein
MVAAPMTSTAVSDILPIQKNQPLVPLAIAETSELLMDSVKVTINGGKPSSSESMLLPTQIHLWKGCRELPVLACALPLFFFPFPWILVSSARRVIHMSSILRIELGYRNIIHSIYGGHRHSPDCPQNER